MTIAPPLRVRGLDVRRDGRPVLTGVDLTVGPGELVALLGANGSGKSTLVKTAVGLLPPAAGTIELFGTPLSRFRDHARLGYVPQRSDAVPGVPATVAEVVLSGRLARRRLAARPSREDRAAVLDALELVGMDQLRRRPVTDLSGGQHQRVLIARALAARPDLLVMDEPTAGVDRHHTAAIADLVGELTDDGVAVLLVAHDLGPVEPHVDQAVVLRDGEVVYTGACGGVREDMHHDHAHHDHHRPVDPADVVPTKGVW
jgi:zinc transport system ATP-binding protein